RSRLHDTAIQLLGRPEHRGESRFCRADVRGEKSATNRAREPRAARPCWTQGSTRRPALWRMETTPRAGRVSHSQTEAAVTRRTDGWCRSKSAPRFLG